MTTTLEVATKFVNHYRTGDFLGAIDAFYAEDIVSVEASTPTPDSSAETCGIESVRERNVEWYGNHEINEFTVEGPWPHHDRFALKFAFVFSPKSGPMAGQRIEMSEIGVYTLNEEQKICREEFFYNMG